MEEDRHAPTTSHRARRAEREDRNGNERMPCTGQANESDPWEQKDASQGGLLHLQGYDSVTKIANAERQ